MLIFLLQNISLLYFQRIAYVSKDLQMSVKFDIVTVFKKAKDKRDKTQEE